MLNDRPLHAGRAKEDSQKAARVERVLSWRKYLATLSEETFFDLIRIYLGEVRTPYNKQDLIESLSAFIRKDETKQGIIRLLTGIDLKLLAAIRFIPEADPAKLERFFFPSISGRQIAVHLDNLLQRLLIFSAGGDDPKKKPYLCLNPLLEDRLFDLLDIGILLPSYQGKAGQPVQAESLDAGKVAAFMAYMLAHPDLSKADGTLKKKCVEELEEQFGDTAQLQVLLQSLRNIGMFTDSDDGKKLIADWKKAESFSLLDSPYQKAYLCAANMGHLSRSSLYDAAQLLFDTLQCAKNRHYSREALLRLSFLIQQNSGDRSLSASSAYSGRFQRLIAGSPLSTSVQESEGSSLAPALDAAIAFGYVVREGSDSEGEAIYCVNPTFFESSMDRNRKLNEAVKIDAAFTFMVMPGLSFQNFLPLIKFLDIVKYDKVCSFEISRKTAMRAFDLGMNAQAIRDVIAKYTQYPIPQNLEISIDEWFGSYSSASLYRGYILKVSGENEIRVRKNPFLSSHIIETFAPGLFLLDFTDDVMAQNAIKHCGLDFIGKIKQKETDRSAFTFYSLRQNPQMPAYAQAEESSGKAAADERQLKAEQDVQLNALREKVQAMRITQEQKDGLMSRIDRRVIISEDQLRPESIRFEKLEASGMDYQGKVHVIENAVIGKCLIELTSSEEDGIFLGEVASFSKYEGEAEVTLRSDNGTERTFSVSKASLVRKVSRPISF